MNNIRIAVTLLNTLRPVGPVSERDQTLLNDTLVRELGADYAGFLAEPVPSGDGTRIDWYVDAKNRPRALEDLSAEEQTALSQSAEKRKKDVLALADKLETGSRNDKEVAQALRNAMMTPESGWLYSVDHKPVIVAWGYVSATTEKRDMSLKAVGIAGATKPAIPEQSIASSAANEEATQLDAHKEQSRQESAPNAAHASQSTATTTEHHVHHKTFVTHEEIGQTRSTPWLSILMWALFALLALFLLWLLFSSSALQRWSGLFGNPTTVVEQGSDVSLQRIDALNREISNLENDLRQRQAQCMAEQQVQNQPPAAQQRPQQEQAPSTPNQPVIVAPTIVINPNDNQQPTERAPQPEALPEARPDERAELPAPETPREDNNNPPQSQRQRELDERIQRSGAQSGVLQITLTWDGKSDLDLSIMCPNNSRVYFKRPRGCGARLDRDANRHPARISREPIENIFFSDPGSIPPKIPVYVDYFDNHGDPRRNIPFRLRIRKTTVDPETGEKKVEDKIIDGIADGSRKRNPRRIYTITNP